MIRLIDSMNRNQSASAHHSARGHQFLLPLAVIPHAQNGGAKANRQ